MYYCSKTVVYSYKRCLTLEPDHAPAYNGMGNGYRKQCQLQDAMDSYKRCLTLKPDYADAYYNMGILSTTTKVSCRMQWTVITLPDTQA